MGTMIQILERWKMGDGNANVCCNFLLIATRETGLLINILSKKYAIITH